MTRMHRTGAMVLAVALCASGCYGSFTLTRTLHQWNKRMSDDRYEGELIFLTLTILPVYQFVALADAFVFNLVEFWTGKSPVVGSDDHQRPQPTRLGRARIIRRDGVTVALDPQGRLLYQAETLEGGAIVVRDAQRQPVALYPPDEVRQVVRAVRQSD